MQRNYTIREACDALHISQSTFFKYAAAKHINTVKFGRRTLIRESELARLLDDGLPSVPDNRQRKPKGQEAQP